MRTCTTHPLLLNQSSMPGSFLIVEYLETELTEDNVMHTICNTKNKMDKVMTLVNNHSNRWRYEYNAQKSAVLVFGEDKRSHDINCKDRNFNIGGRKVPEKSHYDHVGIKHCIFDNDSLTVDEKISKGRKTLNASTGLGVKRKGLSMSICNLIFWLVIVPITTYGAEIWTLSDGDIGNLNKFQRYAGRRFQRFGRNTPNFSSFYGLGWMGITSYICIKKLMFAFTFVLLPQKQLLTVHSVFSKPRYFHSYAL